MKLIALVALAATVAGTTADIAEGAEFGTDDAIGQKLIDDGKAKPAEPVVPPAAAGKTAKARLLVDCQHGKANEVIELPATEIKALCEQGFADSNKAAVAYAEGLKKKPAAE